jgi:hypothetical protein
MRAQDAVALALQISERILESGVANVAARSSDCGFHLR